MKEQNAYLSIAALLHMVIIGVTGRVFVEFLKNERSDFVLYFGTSGLCLFGSLLVWIYLKLFKKDKKKK